MKTQSRYQLLDILANSAKDCQFESLLMKDLLRAAPPRLEVGEAQELVYLDQRDNVIGFGKLSGPTQSLITRYDKNGNPGKQMVTLDPGMVGLTASKGGFAGLAKQTDLNTVRYFDFTGEMAGEARAINPHFVLYVGMDGEKLGTAIIEEHRVLIMNQDGRYLGRKVTQSKSGLWVALHDAWEMFISFPGAA